jgi:alpha-tubulin suppressor-like RCC1 family protein
MKIPLNNLKNEIETRLNAGGLSDLSTCQLQGALAAVNGPASVYRVPSLADLPNVVQSEGMMIYVDDINEYRFSNGRDWTDDVGSDLETYEAQIWSWGSNYCGKLGDGTLISKLSPVQEISGSINWCQVSAGRNHSSGLKSDGTLWSWGMNIHGKLGDGTVIARCSPVQEISASTNWCQVSAGLCRSSGLKSDGTLWSWGMNICGALGDGTIICRCSPVQEISSSTNWSKVSVSLHTSATKTDGTLWSWGENVQGKLGDGTIVVRCSPVREKSFSTNWCNVSTGQGNGSAIKVDGTLWSWGRNELGQIGDGTTVAKCSPVQEISGSTNWCNVSTGQGNGSAIKVDGTLWGWGFGGCGLLGDGTIVNKCSPVQEFCSATNWSQVSSYSASVSAIKANGTLWSWGINDCGKLGDGTVIDKCSPVQEISVSSDWFCTDQGQNHATAMKALFKKGFK